jgi:hypothetical protein
LVENESARLTLNQHRTPVAGVTVNVMLDYKSRTDSPAGPKHHAYAAILTFSNLSKTGMDSIVSSGINKFGRTNKGEEFAINSLLSRSDIVFLKKDEKLLSHPLIKHKVGTIIGKAYEEENTNMGHYSEINILVTGINKGGYAPSRLDDQIHPLWNKDNSSDYSM